MNFIHENNITVLKFFNQAYLPSAVYFWHYFHTLAKSSVSRGKLNKPKANNSTPNRNRAFFVRSVRTPKKINGPKIGRVAFFPMVERKGQPLAVGCVPLVAVFHPFMLYRPTVESLAEKPLNSPKDTATMIYLFAGISRQTYDKTKLHALRVEAETITQARAKLARDYVLVFQGQINPKNHPKLNRALFSGLPNGGNGGSIECTTTYNANRKRYLSGIFLSQNYTSQGEHRPESINFAVRLINRNKAQMRANKVSCLYAVVETVSHPIKGDTYSLTKTYKTIPMKPQSALQAQCAQSAAKFSRNIPTLAIQSIHHQRHHQAQQGGSND